MLYCSELWGITCAEKDTTPYEYLHLKFIKEILGVHSKTSNDACRTELNRLPIIAHKMTIIYYGHFPIIPL